MNNSMVYGFPFNEIREVKIIASNSDSISTRINKLKKVEKSL